MKRLFYFFICIFFIGCDDYHYYTYEVSTRIDENLEDVKLMVGDQVIQIGHLRFGHHASFATPYTPPSEIIIVKFNDENGKMYSLNLTLEDNKKDEKYDTRVIINFSKETGSAVLADDIPLNL